jgi:hypothetical protein
MSLDLLQVVFGAVAGVMWLPRSPEWSHCQRTGIALGLSGVLSLAVAILLVCIVGWHAAVGWLVGIGCVLIVGFLLVGHSCRLAHEKPLD